MISRNALTCTQKHAYFMAMNAKTNHLMCLSYADLYILFLPFAHYPNAHTIYIHRQRISNACMAEFVNISTDNS